jgi:hypothetical protein
MGNPTGRPSAWSEELEKLSWEYVNGEWRTQGDMIPSVVGLCVYIKCSRSMVYRWAHDETKNFGDILEEINIQQQRELVNNGLSGEFNSNITKLVLGKHGFHEKVDAAVGVTGLSHEEWLDQIDE